MAHRIYIGSPLHNLGATVVSLFIAQGITYNGRSSTLTFTDPESKLPQYLGLHQIKDPTRNITQVVELVDSKAIENSEIINYAHNYEKNAYVLNTADPGLNEIAQIQTMNYVYGRVTTDVAICDCSDPFDSDLSRDILKMSEMVILVIDMSPKSVQWMNFWLKQPVFADRKNVFIVINRYDEAIFSLREFAKKIGMPANRVCKIHYNPWVTKCCYTGTLQTILPLAQTLDYRVAAFKNDIAEINQAIESDIMLNSRKGF